MEEGGNDDFSLELVYCRSSDLKMEAKTFLSSFSASEGLSWLLIRMFEQRSKHRRGDVFR